MEAVKTGLKREKVYVKYPLGCSRLLPVDGHSGCHVSDP
jgi:hypothetical protein